MNFRRAISMIELLCVIAVLAALLGILAPAVQNMRATAIRMKSLNNLKQINLAVHNYAAAHDNRVPAAQPKEEKGNHSLFINILPFIEQGNAYERIHNPDQNGDISSYVPQFVSPADPTILASDIKNGPISYGASYAAFLSGEISLQSSFSDGTSNTFAFCEHYYRCGRQKKTFEYKSFGIISPYLAATFNDPYSGDPQPITEGKPPVTHPSFKTFPEIKTFQAAPTQFDCMPLVPQTPHRNGMLMGMMDGSVKTISTGISQSTFWGAITPNGGEILSNW